MKLKFKNETFGKMNFNIIFTIKMNKIKNELKTAQIYMK